MAHSSKLPAQHAAAAPLGAVTAPVTATRTRGTFNSDAGPVSRFRQSEAGRLWQERHFAAALSFLSQSCDDAAVGTARTYLQREGLVGLPTDSGLARAILDAFLADVAQGADKRRDTVARALQLSHGVSYDKTVTLAGALRSEFIASLLPLDECVRELFLREIRQFLPSGTALDRSTFQNIS